MHGKRMWFYIPTCFCEQKVTFCFTVLCSAFFIYFEELSTSVCKGLSYSFLHSVSLHGYKLFKSPINGHLDSFGVFLLQLTL